MEHIDYLKSNETSNIRMLPCAYKYGYVKIQTNVYILSLIRP